MTTRKDAATPAKAELANVHDYFPAITEAQRRALAKWSAFESIVNAPFIPNTDAARQGIFFTVLRLGEGTFPDIDDPTERVEKWLLFVRVAQDCILTLRSGVEVAFEKNQLAKIAFVKGEGLRNDSARALAQILAEDGELPAMQLRELPARVKGQNGAIVLHTPLEAVL